MAIDTEAKRASIAGYIIPSATITPGDRPTIAGKYSGIIAVIGITGLVSVAISASLPGVGISTALPGVALSANLPAATITQEVG